MQEEDFSFFLDALSYILWLPKMLDDYFIFLGTVAVFFGTGWKTKMQTRSSYGDLNFYFIYCEFVIDFCSLQQRDNVVYELNTHIYMFS